MTNARVAVLVWAAVAVASAAAPGATDCGALADCLSCAAESHCKFSLADQTCERLVHDKPLDETVFARFDDTCPSSHDALPAPAFLPDWMGALAPVLGNLTLLDLSLPGTHDTLTADLSLVVSDGGIDGMDRLAEALHKLTEATTLGAPINDFIRTNAQTHGLNVTQQLDNGVRFLDFRWMQESEGEWLPLHFMQGKRLALDHMAAVSAWLDAHPTEIVVVWTSKHGSQSAVGDDAFPGVDDADKQALWAQVVELFADTIVDHTVTLINETTIDQMVARGHRAVFYVSDYARFTANSTLALDAALIDNELGSSVTEEENALASERACFASANDTKAKLKPQRGFYLRSMATSSPGTQVEKALKLRFDPFASDDDVAECAATFNIPNFTSWCPPTLEDVGQLASYYKQIPLDEVHEDPNLDLPNAIYLDALDWNGTIRTGTTLLNGRARGDEHPTTAYAYVDTFLAYNLRVACDHFHADQDECATLKETVEARRAAYPLARWDDPEHGRLASWP